MLLASCAEVMGDIGCEEPTYEEQDVANTLYNDMLTARVSMDYDQAKKIFGCYYYRGDWIYSYSRIFDKGYILVRGNKAIIYRKVAE